MEEEEMTCNDCGGILSIFLTSASKSMNRSTPFNQKTTLQLGLNMRFTVPLFASPIS
jgi:hypothetical protein